VSDFVANGLLLLIGAAATGLVAGIGFLIKRRIGRDDPVERFIAQHERMLKLNPGSPAPLPPADRSRLEQVLRELNAGKRSEEQSNAPDRLMTQAEMNQLAAQEAERELIQVRRLIDRLRMKLRDEDGPVLDEAQSAWERYVDVQARLAAQSFEGGSIMPTIYHSERAALARDRNSHLQRVLDYYEL
jgi:uncharacterized protein YecT (DUF1311 family)